LSQFLKQGMPLEQAYQQTLYSTGKAVAFTGITLAIGVATWMWSPIKFQADMGILLTFMFLLNMVGALTLLPALASYLLPEGNQQ
jgi:predicted RND superfamily exporter protein